MPWKEIPLELDGRAGRLEALYAGPPALEPAPTDKNGDEGTRPDVSSNRAAVTSTAGASPGAMVGGALILHPHPLYGGNMHNKVVYHARRVCTGLGLATLRLNLRGTGTSQGNYDDGQGELDDVRTGLDFLRAHLLVDAPLYLVGFSFGAWLAYRVGAAESDVRGIVGLGTPVGWAEFGKLADAKQPKLFIHGGRDQYCNPEDMRLAFPGFAKPKRLLWIEEADHFFHDHLPELVELLRENFPFEE